MLKYKEFNIIPQEVNKLKNQEITYHFNVNQTLRECFHFSTFEV